MDLEHVRRFTKGLDQRCTHLAISCIDSEAAEIDEIATGERTARLLQAAAGRETAKVDRHETETFDHALDEFGRLWVIPGDEDDAAPTILYGPFIEARGDDEDGEPKKDWRPGTDSVQDIRPGSVLTRKYEDRQRKPDDLEAQEGQRPIAVHALENLGTSDTGITMLRHLLREQIKRVGDGLDPTNVMRDASANRKIPTNAWNTILSPTEASVFQVSEV